VRWLNVEMFHHQLIAGTRISSLARIKPANLLWQSPTGQ
jgi:hypothetical protein